jgi:hypothetical protein
MKQAIAKTRAGRTSFLRFGESKIAMETKPATMLAGQNGLEGNGLVPRGKAATCFGANALELIIWPDGEGDTVNVAVAVAPFARLTI